MENRRYPTDAEAKKLIVEIGRRMYAKNFVAANDGNISVKVGPNECATPIRPSAHPSPSPA